MNFNPPFPRGKGRTDERVNTEIPDFNPPFPRGKGLVRPLDGLKSGKFQSTLPSREGTAGKTYFVHDLIISIHPSLAGRDFSISQAS